jgi:uncharacterized membrane protein
MNFWSDIFSFLCSQEASRSFLLDGRLLPVCQRCAGLYLGMGLSFLYLALNPGYRTGFPRKSIVYVNVACLLAMPVFGFHFLDPGPAWRLWSGLIYGHAIVLLLVPASWILCTQGTRESEPSQSGTLSFWLFFGFLNSTPLWFPIQSVLFFYSVLALMIGGLSCAAGCLFAVPFCTIRRRIRKGDRNECPHRS